MMPERLFEVLQRSGHLPVAEELLDASENRSS